MRRRRSKEIDIFNLSFLDVLSCGLGAVVTLLLLEFHIAAETDRLKRLIPITIDNIDRERARVELDREEERVLNALLEKFKGELPILERRLEYLIKRREELRGLRFMGVQSNKRNIVFLVDLSGSMEKHKDILQRTSCALVELLRFDGEVQHRFNIITFRSVGDQPVLKRFSEKEDLVDATDARKIEAVTWLKLATDDPDGETPTLQAFEEAMKIGKVESIWVLTDGEPTHVPKELQSMEPDDAERLKAVGKMIHDRTGNVEIRCLGIGEKVYKYPTFRVFLKGLVRPQDGKGYAGL